MYFLYDLLVYIASFILRILGLFDAKIRRFVHGRKASFKKLSEALDPGDRVLWVHCASLGEFEQGRPVIEAARDAFPEKKLVLTFFSPSGYEVRKDYQTADVVCYLPLDTARNSRRFLDLVQPEVAVFVKYEFWPNILRLLRKRRIKTLLISGIFRPQQAFFRWYGSWLRTSLKSITHFFVQDQRSSELLSQIGIENYEVSGDTRFDRVYAITKQDNRLDFMDAFTGNAFTIVAGSTWKDDEKMLVEYINSRVDKSVKFIIAPHNIHSEDIEKLVKSITRKTALYSKRPEMELESCEVLILDTVGILTKVFSYGHVAYVGGGFTRSGIHNVLEPATFGLPVVIGPNYHKFREAVELVALKACYPVENSQKLSLILDRLYKDQVLRKESGEAALHYIEDHKGATEKIINYLKS
jgi:3-deoxy-D-manno-octulosonic-acid transferase